MSEIMVSCPICRSSQKIEVSYTVINQIQKSLLTINVPKDRICEHNFQFYLDKNFNIRGYQKIDIDIPEEDKQEIELDEIEEIGKEIKELKRLLKEKKKTKKQKEKDKEKLEKQKRRDEEYKIKLEKFIKKNNLPPNWKPEDENPEDKLRTLF